jgi:hypothetical protein
LKRSPVSLKNGVVGLAEDEDLVVQAGRGERGLRGGARRVDALVEAAVDAEHRGLGALEARVLRERPVEGRRRVEAVVAGREQSPDHAAAEAEPDCREAAAGDAPLELGEGVQHVLVEADGRDRGELGGHLRLAGEGARAALLGEQVERERGPAAGGEAPRDLADVVVQPAVLVDDQHRAGRLARGRRPRRHEGAVAAGERDRHRRDGRPLDDLGVVLGAATVVAPAAVRRGRGLGLERRQHRRGRGAAEPQQAEAAHRLPARDDPVAVILGDLLGQVALELGHRSLLTRVDVYAVHQRPPAIVAYATR